jgi:hypothetical protein
MRLLCRRRTLLTVAAKHAFVTIEEPGGYVESRARDAAGNVTGQWIAVDGGSTAR